MKDANLKPCGCCEPPAAATPEEITNRPGLPAIRYRVASYASFRQAMLQAIAHKPELDGWAARTKDDYGIALLEMWAYVGDILTFYQERIANEVFLRTALLRESVLRLAALLDYQPAPGVAATAHLAFTLEKDKQVQIPEALLVQSVPGQDEKPQKFETIEEIAADARLNQVRVFPRPQPYNPFAQGNTCGMLLSGPERLAPDDDLIIWNAMEAEEKTVASLVQQDGQTILHWRSAVLGSGFERSAAHMHKVVRQMHLFGHNVPTRYLPPEKRQGPIPVESPPLDSPQQPRMDYDLDARYERLKPGTQLLVVQRGTENDYARLVTITKVTENMASLGDLESTVTQISLVRSISSAPTAVFGYDNKLKVFARGEDGALWHASWDGTNWSDWQSLGGELTSAPTVCSHSPSWLDVFARGADNTLLHKWWSGTTWGNWASLGGVLTSAPAALSWFVPGGVRRVVLARGRDNDLQCIWKGEQSAYWETWESLGGELASAPTAVSWGPERIDVFTRGADDAVWHISREGGAWSDWESLGGEVTSAPAAVSSGPGRIDVFARGADNALWHTWWDGHTWAAWESRGGTLTSAPAAALQIGTGITVLARGIGGSLCYREWYTGPGKPTWRDWNLWNGLGEIPDVRKVTLYEMAEPELILWNRRYPDAITDDWVYVPLDQLETIEPDRTLILEDEGAEPQVVTVTEVDRVDADDGSRPHLAIRFTPALRHSLDARSAVLYGNVAQGTHGETVADKVLGSGDASAAFQSFEISKSPVTFVPRPGAPNGAENTLTVHVDGVRWSEERNLHGHTGDERVYTAAVDDEGTMKVQFGDGATGARLPTGRNNVIADYRLGLGHEGNVRADAITTLLDRPLGLKGVTNPGAARGGADPETLDEARANAPNTVRTFGRIVSLRDFEDAAREFAGVAKARAACVWDGEERVVRLTVAGDNDTEITGTTFDNLVTDLDSRRDPNRRLVVGTYRRVPLQVEAAFRILPDRVAKDVLTSARDALREFFAFDNLDLGQPIYLSDVYQVLQDVEGVEAVDVNHLQFKEETDRVSHWATEEPVQSQLRIFYNELAVIDAPDDVVVELGMRPL